MALFEDQIIPYLGPGFCSSVSCKFFHYEPFHKPIEGCSSFNNFMNSQLTTSIFDPKFTLHYFMDFASNEKWRCYNKQCQISWSEPFHCQGDKRCISYQKFCDYFNITFISVASEPKKPALVNERPMKNCIHERKQVSSNTVMPGNNNADKSYDSDYPELTSDSGEDTDDSESDCDSDCEKHIPRVVNQMFNDIFESKKSAKLKISESNCKSTPQHVYNDLASEVTASGLNACSDLPSNTEGLCCKCHSQGAKCTNCRCKKSGKHCTNCLPLVNGRCCNISPKISNGSSLVSEVRPVSHALPMSFVDEKMMQAFGSTLTNSEGDVINGRIEKIWKQAALLRGRVYRVPGGSIGREFTAVLAKEYELLASGVQKSEKPSMIGKLILQKDKKIRKSSDIKRLIKRRLKMWKDDLLEELIQEAEACDRKLPMGVTKMSDEEAILVFSRMVLQGKIREALRFITNRSESGGLLQPDDDAGKGKTVQEVLESKHPPQSEAVPEAFIVADLPTLVDVDVTESHIVKAAKHLSGGAGISALDASQWQVLLLKHGGASEELRSAMASLTMRLANTIVQWDDIRALKAKKLIALDKCPGIRPIGIGDVADRLCAKVMIDITGDDVQAECLADQLCSGIKAGIEGAIHAFSSMFDELSNDGWGLLLMDASNAFNSVNRAAAIWNSRILWSRSSRYIFNAYQGYAMLFIAGSKTYILSREGVTQGDPMAMLVYGIAILPLTKKLKNLEKWKQNWYADDSACLAKFKELKEWLELLILEGPKYGYFPEPEKSYLVVHPNLLDEAKLLFKDIQINIVTGHRFLGGYVGSSADCQDWVQKKIEVWINSVHALSKAANLQPQASFVAFTRSLQAEWTFLQRVIAGTEVLFTPLRSVIVSTFLPNLCGFSIAENEASLFCRPSNYGGLGISDPVQTAPSLFNISKEATNTLSHAIINGSNFDLAQHDSTLQAAITKKKNNEKLWSSNTLSLLESFSTSRKRTIQRKLEHRCSGWLSVLPTTDNEFCMNADEFRDSIALRYGRIPKNLPPLCDADGEVFDVNHALNCPRGGLVYGRHNEARDLNCDLLERAGLKQVISEPIIRETDRNGENGLRADWGVRAFWEPQRHALFDICVLNADSTSIADQSLESIFQTRRNMKKDTYSKAAEARRASFTPIIATCDAILDREAELYIKQLAIHMSNKWKSPFSNTVGWLRARFQICILRSVSLCLRGSRTRWRGAGASDRVGIPQMEH